MRSHVSVAGAPWAWESGQCGWSSVGMRSWVSVAEVLRACAFRSVWQDSYEHGSFRQVSVDGDAILNQGELEVEIRCEGPEGVPSHMKGFPAP